MVLSGRRPHPYSELIKPVFILNAIQHSYQTKKTVEIKDYE